MVHIYEVEERPHLSDVEIISLSRMATESFAKCECGPQYPENMFDCTYQDNPEQWNRGYRAWIAEVKQRKGFVITVDQNDGLVLCLPPGVEFSETLGGYFRREADKAQPELDKEQAENKATYLRALDESAVKDVKRKCLYMLELVVAHGKQGEGRGRALLEGVFAKAESLGCDVYSECDSIANHVSAYGLRSDQDIALAAISRQRDHDVRYISADQEGPVMQQLLRGESVTINQEKASGWMRHLFQRSPMNDDERSIIPTNKAGPPVFDSYPSTSQTVDTYRPKAAAPSFASFPHAAPLSRREEPDDREHKSKKRKKEHKRDKHDKSERSLSKRPRKEESYQSTQQIVKPPPLAAPKYHVTAKPKLLGDTAAPINVFPRRSKPTSTQHVIVDPTGDPNNQRYQGLHAGDVPRFRRINGGRVFGLDPTLRITRPSSIKDLVLLPRNQHALARYTDKAYRWKVTAKDVQILQLVPADTSSTETTDQDTFISLLEDDISSSESEIEQTADPNYRELNGPRSRSPSPSESEDELSKDVKQGRTYFDSVTLKNQNLSARVRVDPDDIGAWLDFVRFQDQNVASIRANSIAQAKKEGSVAGNNVTQKRVIERDERRAIADGKLAILDKALLLCRNESGLRELAKERLKVGEEVWEMDELQREWRKAVKRDSGLTKDWLEWFGRDGRLFKMRTGYSRAVEGCLHEMEVHDQFDTFDRSVRMLRDAGYVERALAAYQALLELNLFLPEHLSSCTVAQRLDELELFWDAEGPRIGEQGARGWRNTDSDAVAPPDPTSTSIPEAASSTANDGYLLWAQKEEQEALRKQKPARLTDPTENSSDEDDVYRVVLFADIRPLLFSVPHDYRLNLLTRFFAFLSLPLAQQGISTNDMAEETSVLSDAFFGPAQSTQHQSFEIIAGEAMETVRQGGTANLADGYGRRWPMSFELLWPSRDGSWFSQWPNKEALAPVDIERIRAVFELLHDYKMLDTFYLSVWLSLECINNAKAASKLAKRLLASDQQNLILWDCYARIERHRDRLKEARHCYSQTLLASPSFSEASQAQELPLFRSWAEMEWEEGNEKAALTVLASAVLPANSRADLLNPFMSGNSNVPPTTTTMVRAKQVYEAKLAKVQICSKPEDQAFVFNAALFAYLQAHEVSAVVQVFGPILSFNSGSAEEQLIAAHAKILYRHSINRALYRPGDLRGVLELALNRFPKNSVFQQLYLFNEARTRIQNRVRTFFDKQIQLDDSATSLWLFRIYAELHIDARQYNTFAVHSLFERATTALRQQPSIAVWCLYLQWTIAQNQLQQAKSILFRAVDECPSRKDFYLMAFRAPFRSIFRRNELDELYNSMEERELRLIVDMSVYRQLEHLDFGQNMDLSDEEGGPADEAFRDVIDRQRLMPY